MEIQILNKTEHNKQLVTLNRWGLTRSNAMNDVDWYPEDTQDVMAARSWINAHMDQLLERTRLGDVYSYTLKHTVECDIGGYISNGEIIALMVEAGFKARIPNDSDDTKNCFFEVDIA